MSGSRPSVDMFIRTSNRNWYFISLHTLKYKYGNPDPVQCMWCYNRILYDLPRNSIILALVTVVQLKRLLQFQK